MRLKAYIFILLAAVALPCCGKKNQQKAAETSAPAAFAADSAYAYIEAQVGFGARVPGTEAHRRCRAYLSETLSRFGAEVSLQEGALPNYAGKQQPIVNIIGRYNPTAKRRVLLCSHWDCRPWSDQETDPQKQQIPVMGANDGASGVGVLLEIARQLQAMEQAGQPIPGVDIVFFDAEDMGTPDFLGGGDEKSWCLGSQLWATEYAQMHAAGNADTLPRIRYGVLLDMVASPDAIFLHEYFSQQYAAQYVDALWDTAASLGYGRFFQNEDTYAVTDDHYFVNTIAHVPCLDIIHYNPASGTGFPEYWHTNHDDMRNVARPTLDAVGKVLLTTIIQ